MESQATTISRTGRSENWGEGTLHALSALAFHSHAPCPARPGFRHRRAGVPRAPRQGLTLVEVLISVAILAVGAVLIMQALARGAYGLTVASNRSTAYAFAAAKLVDLELSAQQGTVPKTRGRFRTDRGRFEWTVHTAPLDEPQLELIMLTVSWRQGRHAYESSYSTAQRVPLEEEAL